MLRYFIFGFSSFQRVREDSKIIVWALRCAYMHNATYSHLLFAPMSEGGVMRVVGFVGPISHTHTHVLCREAQRSVSEYLVGVHGFIITVHCAQGQAQVQPRGRQVILPVDRQTILGDGCIEVPTPLQDFPVKRNEQCMVSTNGKSVVGGCHHSAEYLRPRWYACSGRIRYPVGDLRCCICCTILLSAVWATMEGRRYTRYGVQQSRPHNNPSSVY